MTKLFLFLLLATACGLTNPVDLKIQVHPSQALKPKIAFTFDDGSIDDFGAYKLETWNQRLLDHLKKTSSRPSYFRQEPTSLAPKENTC